MGIKLTRPQNPKIADPITGVIDQNWAMQLSALFDAVAGPLPLRVFAKAQLPSAAKYANSMVYVSDDVAGPCIAVSDGDELEENHVGSDRFLMGGHPVVPRPRVTAKEKTNITYFVTLPMHRKLKLAAIDHNTSMQQLLDEALGLLFAKYGLGSFEPVPPKK